LLYRIRRGQSRGACLTWAKSLVEKLTGVVASRWFAVRVDDHLAVT
jgi:hypothetical protein